jgi:hypothetical protein
VMEVIGWSFWGFGPRVSLQDVIGIISLNLMGRCPNPPTQKSNPREGCLRVAPTKPDFANAPLHFYNLMDKALIIPWSLP